VDEARLMQYFPIDKVINGLFDISKLLFNVDFKVIIIFEKKKKFYKNIFIRKMNQLKQINIYGIQLYLFIM
jgi:Zn-dependent oligopeptidase